MKILHMEANPEFKKQIAQFLEANGHTMVHWVEGIGPMGRSWLREKPDVVLCDTSIPGVYMEAWIPFLRGHKEFEHATFVMLSRPLHEGMRAIFERIGVHHFLEKPCNLNGLYATLQQIENGYTQQIIIPIMPKMERRASVSSLL